MTDLALGAKCGFPSGGRQIVSLARATPSRNSMAPSTRPVNPIPVSDRNERREMPQQSFSGDFIWRNFVPASSDGHKIVVVQQNQDEVLSTFREAILRL